MSDPCPYCDRYKWFVSVCRAIIRNCKPVGMFTKLQNSLKKLDEDIATIDTENQDGE